MFDLWVNSAGPEVGCRRQQLLKEAAHSRLARLARVYDASFGQRAALWLGNLFIAIGVGLRRRCNERRGQAYLSLIPFESRTEY
jgi:hypothetical protein